MRTHGVVRSRGFAELRSGIGVVFGIHLRRRLGALTKRATQNRE
jgi:hypothetical protein